MIDNINKDIISRQYAINQIEMSILESNNSEEKEYFECFKNFLQALPTTEELNEQVSCTECEYLKRDGESVSCCYESKCYLRNIETSAPMYVRQCFSLRDDLAWEGM